MTETLTTTTETTTQHRRGRSHLARATAALIGTGALAFTSLGAASATPTSTGQNGSGDEPVVSQEWADAALEAAEESSDPQAAATCAEALLDHRDLGYVEQIMADGPTEVSRAVSAPAGNSQGANSGVECTFSAYEADGGPTGGAEVSVAYISDAEEVQALKADPEAALTPSEQERGNPEYTTQDFDGVTTVTQSADEFPDVPFTASITYPEQDGDEGTDSAVVVKTAGSNAESVPYDDLEVADEITSGENTRELALSMAETHSVWSPVWDEITSDEDRLATSAR